MPINNRDPHVDGEPGQQETGEAWRPIRLQQVDTRQPGSRIAALAPDEVPYERGLGAWPLSEKDHGLGRKLGVERGCLLWRKKDIPARLNQRIEDARHHVVLVPIDGSQRLRLDLVALRQRDQSKGDRLILRRPRMAGDLRGEVGTPSANTRIRAPQRRDCQSRGGDFSRTLDPRRIVLGPGRPTREAGDDGQEPDEPLPEGAGCHTVSSVNGRSLTQIRRATLARCASIAADVGDSMEDDARPHLLRGPTMCWSKRR
jgi:hypothetical protein